MKKREEITFDRFVRLIASALGLVLAYILIVKLSGVLIPFLIAWLIAYIMYPMVHFLQYKCRLKSRVLSIIAAISIVVGAFGIGLWMLLPPVMEEFVNVKNIIIDYVTTDESVNDLSSQVAWYIKTHFNVNQIVQALTFEDITTLIEERVPQLFSVVYTSVNALLGIVASFIALIYIFFILMDYEQINAGIIKMVPPSKRNIVRTVLNDVATNMNAYFRGQSLIAFLVGIMFAIGFSIIGLPLAIPLGLFIGVLNLVPYLQTIGILPTTVLALLQDHYTGEDFWNIMLQALIVFVVVQGIQDWVLTPKIMGKATGMNPAAILLSLSVWGSLLGFVGFIIALPLTTLIYSYYKRYILEAEENEDVPSETA